MPRLDLPLFSLREGRIRTLHLAWFAFFLTFVIWFNHAPLLAFIREALDLDDQQVKALLHRASGGTSRSRWRRSSC